MFIELGEQFLKLTNDPERSTMAKIAEGMGWSGVTLHPDHPAVLVGCSNLHVRLREAGTSDREHLRPLLRDHWEKPYVYPDGHVLQMRQDGCFFDPDDDPPERTRSCFGLADTLEEVLAYFKLEFDAQDRFYVLGIEERSHMPRKDGPHITREVEEGEAGPFVKFHLYELDPVHFQSPITP